MNIINKCTLLLQVTVGPRDKLPVKAIPGNTSISGRNSSIPGPESMHDFPSFNNSFARLNVALHITQAWRVAILVFL